MGRSQAVTKPAGKGDGQTPVRPRVPRELALLHDAIQVHTVAGEVGFRALSRVWHDLVKSRHNPLELDVTAMSVEERLDRTFEAMATTLVPARASIASWRDHLLLLRYAAPVARYLLEDIERAGTDLGVMARLQQIQAEAETEVLDRHWQDDRQLLAEIGVEFRNFCIFLGPGGLANARDEARRLAHPGIVWGIVFDQHARRRTEMLSASAWERAF